MAAPLDGIRVIDMSRVLAGPSCGQTLADLGAEVIKIERPGLGDDTRGWGPPFLADRDGHETTDAAYYLAANRGKRSVLADIASPAGQAMIKTLAADADVLIENFKVGQLARYGLDYDSLRTINPRLVYCSITGFGQTGPLAHRAGYDFVIQGMSGFMSITGEADDQPGGGPQKAGVAISDLMTGMVSAQAILAALLHRERGGTGQYIDMALLDVMVTSLANMNTNFLVSGTPPHRWGNAHPNVVPYQTFKASDGWIIVAAGNDGQFRKLCVAGGCPQIADDARYASNALRIRNRATLIPALADMIERKSQADWIAELERVGVPCGPINDLDQVFAMPQIQARGLRVDIERDDAGPVPLVGSPIKFSATPVRYSLPPPRLGQHTEQVLREVLNYDDRQVADYMKTVDGDGKGAL
ncbi:MAG: CaiB/BaiF CoA-transferase family protein [Burkholderiaceae bacterium]